MEQGIASMIRLSAYNREFVVLNRWHIPYAPAYGWFRWMQELVAVALRIHPAYRPGRRSDDA